MATATGSIRASADHTVPVPIRRRISQPSLILVETAPRWGLLPASLMYFCFGRPMHHCSGVDTGRPQAVLLHAGPGLLQGAAAIQAAYSEEIPLLVMSGESLS